MNNADRKTLIINETANAVTHGIGAILAIAALVILIVFATRYGGPGMLSVSVFTVQPWYCFTWPQRSIIVFRTKGLNIFYAS
jgi:predicted membrane channel-forming protein YqfA (hemolysin III family)